MEAIIRNVRDFEANERKVLEHVLGQRLEENQQVIIKVVSSDGNPVEGSKEIGGPQSRLPDWCNVYEGLTDEEIAEVEEVILQRSDLTRPSE
jgi:hypothetical protein